jgi:putative hydrolase of the HAD superfamily
MSIQAVFFDAAGTLMKPVRGVGESYTSLAVRHGKEVAPAEVMARFRECFENSPRLAFPGAAESDIEILERQWWKDLVGRVFEPWGRFEKFDAYFAELFDYFAQPTAWALYPEVMETLAALKQRGLILDVISNFDSRLVRILDGLGVGSQFESIFVSSRIGYAKPDRRIFDAALHSHGLTPAQALHVGDSEIYDLDGARQAGLKGVLIDRRKNSGAPESIDNLRAILALLDD